MFCERLKQQRVKMSMSQKELAEKLGKSQQTVAKWENGSTFPKPTALKRLTEILDVTSDYLLGIPKKLTDSEIIYALFGDDEQVTDEMYEDVKQFALFLKEHRKDK